MKRIRDVDDTGSQGLDLADALDADTGIGGGEAGTAGAHQDRELVELLQNGRDAIEESDDEESGTIYVEVRESGVLVGNTGAPFDIQSADVREDLRKITFSRKSEGAIGEKGVGLTSVCMVGEAYEVWTQPEEDTIDRFQCGPVNPTAAVVSRTEAATKANIQARLAEFKSQLSPDSGSIEEQFAEINPSIPIDEVRPADIETLPFFYYPLGLRVPNTPGDTRHPLQKRAMELIQGTESVPNENGDEPINFTTAVIIRFRDDLLRDFRDALDTPQNNEFEPKSVAKDLWSRLSYADTLPSSDQSGQVTPESLVHFENVNRLLLRNEISTPASESDRYGKSEEWNIKRRRRLLPKSKNVDRTLQATDIRVTIDPAGDNNVVEEHFDQFERPLESYPRFADRIESIDEEKESKKDENSDQAQSASEFAYVRLLVPRGCENTSVSPVTHAYPLYLFYPIAGTNKQFPFCLHGNFEVSKDRKELYSHSTAHNALVLQEAAELIGDVATIIAKTTAGGTNNVMATGNPWNLLPPEKPSSTQPPELEAVIAEEETADVLECFSTAIYDKLNQQACLPSPNADGPIRLDQALLHPYVFSPD